jgi:hypothetical protein
MTPAVLLLLLLATTNAALAHVVFGRRWRQLPIFWLTACVGCLLAYGIGWRFPLNVPAPANVPVLEAVLVAWVLLIIVARLRV